VTLAAAAVLVLAVAGADRSVAQASTPAEGGQARPVSTEVIAEVRVHGNQLTPDDEILKLAGVEVGTPFLPETTDEVERRLRRSGQFRDVQVLKRFASIADPTRIALVLVVDEGPVDVIADDRGGPARVVRRRAVTNFMVMPILDVEDGYGLTYGARLAYAGVVGRQSRLSFPLSWGGMKRAGVEFDRTLARGPLSRFEAGAAVERRTNPAFDEQDDRRRVWVTAGRSAGPIKVAGGGGWQRVAFVGETDRLRSVMAEAVVDTRLDPSLPRDAVYGLVAVERLSFASGAPATIRLTFDGRGYVGLIGQSVLVLRARREQASRPLPAYLKSLLGGDSSLRGFEPGAFVGDRLATGSLELRIPLSAALSAGKVGVSVFVDAGTAYDDGQAFRDQALHTGAGASVWLTATVFRMGLTVAHGRGAGTRVTFGAGLTR